MIEVYVQLSMTAELCGKLTEWDADAEQTCQQIANNMQAEVRAIQDNTELARFHPQRTEDKERL